MPAIDIVYLLHYSTFRTWFTFFLHLAYTHFLDEQLKQPTPTPHTYLATNNLK